MDKETPDPASPANESQPPEDTRKEIPLVSVQSEEEMIAQEMADLFEEDKVTHKHGSSEPEAD